MNWQFAFKHGRAPSIIQMRLLQIVAVNTPGVEILPLYKHLFDYEVQRGTIYSTLSVMKERGWTSSKRREEHWGQKVYAITSLGREVLSDAIEKYSRAASRRKK